MSRLPHEIAARLRHEARFIEAADVYCDDEGREYAADCLEAAAAIEKQIADLAQCYRLSGADTDGDEDWRIAPHAVEEVARMRQQMDEADEALVAAGNSITAQAERIAELEREAFR